MTTTTTTVEQKASSDSGAKRFGGATPLCKFFQSDSCRYGQECRFSHSLAASSSTTVAPTTTTTTKVAKKATKYNNRSEKGRKHDKVACRYWLNGEKCRFGDQCSYYHPAGKFGKGGEVGKGGGEDESDSSSNSSSSGTSSSSSSEKEFERRRQKYHFGGFKSRGGLRGGRSAGWKRADYGSKGNEEGLRRNGTGFRSNNGADEQGEAKSAVLCRYWKRGIVCRFGRDCRFRHVIHPHDDNEEAAFQQSGRGGGGGGGRGRKPFTARPFSRIPREGNKKEPRKPKHIAKKNSTNQQKEEEEEANSGGGILGFNADQVMDLLEKNVKPWDEGARAALEQKKEQQQQQGDEVKQEIIN